MYFSERNNGPTVVVVDKSSKSSLYDDGEECNEQVKDRLVANEEIIKILAENDDCVERFGKDGRGNLLCGKRFFLFGKVIQSLRMANVCRLSSW